jgi:photosystem II stability/assembly factor-like uncharacterized protein
MFPRRGALICASCFSVGALLAAPVFGVAVPVGAPLAAPAFDSDPPDEH